jgi:hypothetical protein
MRDGLQCRAHLELSLSRDDVSLPVATTGTGAHKHGSSTNLSVPSCTHGVAASPVVRTPLSPTFSATPSLYTEENYGTNTPRAQRHTRWRSRIHGGNRGRPSVFRPAAPTAYRTASQRRHAVSTRGGVRVRECPSCLPHRPLRMGGRRSSRPPNRKSCPSVVSYRRNRNLPGGCMGRGTVLRSRAPRSRGLARVVPSE